MSKIELLQSPSELARIPGIEAEIKRLAATMAAEIIADREQWLFEPFFRSRQVAYAIKRLQTVSEQQINKIYYARHGCAICETVERIHGGNGMCTTCYTRELQRRKQICGEQIRGQESRPTRGRIRLDRMIPANAPVDGIHHTRHERSTEQERAIFQRVAEQRGLTYHYVRSIGVGLRRNDAVAAEIREEAEKQKRLLARRGTPGVVTTT